jgi:protein TonB
MPNPAAAPTEAPAQIKPEPPPIMRTVVGGIQAAPAAQQAVQSMAPPPPPPPPPAPLRVGGDIKEPKKTRDVRPVYPKIAQAAKVSGVVILEATISKEGEVRDVKVLRSIPMLDSAALDAVRQWRYTPPLLNGVPVDVIMTVTVNFTLN